MGALAGKLKQRVKPFFEMQAAKEAVLFPKSKYPLSFKPFLFYQGLVISLLLVLLASFFVPQNKINQSLVIKTTIVKQASTIIAGGQPAQWIVLVKKSDITKQNHLVQLPKSARNINITTISAQQAKDILQLKPMSPLSLEQKSSLAMANLSKLFLANLDQGAQSVDDAAAPDIQVASDAIAVDLLSQAPTTDEIASSPEAPRNDGVTATDETATTEKSDYVALQYTTPAPTITEQETDTGKIVTVSSSNIEKVDCEALNPDRTTLNASDVLSNAGASLFNGFVNAIKSIAKFFPSAWLRAGTADLEQAVNVVTDGNVLNVGDETPTTNLDSPVQGNDENVETPAETSAPTFDVGETPAIENPSLVESNIQDLTPVSGVVSPSNESGIVNPTPTPTPSPTETPAPVEIPAPVDTEYQKQEAAYQACLAQQVQLTDVLASTSIPEIYKVGEESKIKIKWKNNGNQDVSFHADDTNDDGYLDYIEWTIPHLSTQVFEIIFISKAFELDENQNIVADIYDTVATQDGNYATVPQGNYVRVTFDKTLTRSNDITIYARPAVIPAQAEIQVYPVYDDGNGNLTEGPKLETVSDGVNPDFNNIDHDGKYRVLLTNLATPTDMFDLRISGNPSSAGLDIDYIVDPDVTYYTTGTLTSTNILSGVFTSKINSFSYTASAIPAVTGVTVQFSQNGSTWCDSLNNCGGANSDTLSVGTNTISLSTLSWSGANFYYKMSFTSDGTDTPALDDASVNYDAITTQNPQASLTTATANGTIDSLSGGNATTRGFKYGLTETGTWDVHEDGSFGVGAYSLPITGLSNNTTYHIRAYTINPSGTLYGNWVSFLTSSYYSSGTLISTNLLSGETATIVDSFTYNLSAKPIGTEAIIQFSSDNSSWYNSAHVLDGSNTLTTGTNNVITLSGGWPGTGFYYKVTFTSDGTYLYTPVLDDISVAFTNDTTPPTVSSVAVQTGLTVNVVFSEPMGTGVTTASNYTVSGTGKGTLANNPNTAALVSGNTYVLTWSSGEMFNGGDITITVANAQDLAGNAVGSPNSGTHTGGGIGTAPTVSITSPTTSTSVNASKVITFSDNETTSPQCSVDNINWTACTSNTTTLGNISQFAGLIEGNTFTLYLKDTDAAGNIGTNNVANITKDTTAPTGTITLGGGETYWTTNTSPTIALTTDDASQYQLCLDSATAGSNCASVARAWATYAASPAVYDFSTDGVKTLYVQFKDAIENISATYSDSITIDASAPNAATSLGWSESSPHNSTAVNALWTKSNSSDLANQKIQFYSDASCSSASGSLIDLASNTLQTRAFTGIDGTTYAYKITSIDNATNSTVSACSSAMIIDTTFPVITITNPTTTPAQSKTITASTDSGTLFMSNTFGSDCDGTLSFDAYTSQTFLTEASNGKKVCYKAVDSATNTTYTMSDAIAGIDTTLPTASGFNPANTSIINDSTPTITFSLSETGDCYAATTDWGYEDMANPTNGAVNCSENELNITCQMLDLAPDGTKQIYISCEDWPAANKNTSANNTNLTYTLDTTPPTLSFTDDVEVGPVVSDTITESWGDATIKKWDYDSDGVCSVTSGDYSKTDSDSMDQSVQTNNGKYICLYGEDAVGNSATQVSANDINIDITAPTGANISVITADSANQLTIIANTATDAGVGLHATPYQFQETTGNDGADSSSWQADTNYTDTGLTPNTRYTYKVRAKDILDNTSGYSAESSKYTLADTPGAPTLAVDSSTQITATLSADSNPAGTYYLITNTTNSDVNSDWTTDEEWISSGLTCNTEYTFTVKARNGDGVETATATATATTSTCASQITGGGGGGIDFRFLPPTPPLNGFQLLINNGSLITSLQDVTLFIRGSNTTPRMSISNDPNFTNATQESYDIVKQWRLTDNQGQKTVYLKFFTAYGVASNIITATINYQKPNIITPIINIITPPTTTTTPPVITPIPLLPPVTEVVKPEAPLSMQDIWNILPTKAINQFVLSPVPQEISDLVAKFPNLEKTFQEIGILKITDISKLANNNLTLPNLSQIVNPVAQNLEPGQIVIPNSTGASSLTPGQLANLEGIPLESLTSSAKTKIPTEILFAKSAGGLVDFNTMLSLNEQGHPQQQFTTLVNQSIQLIIKPDSPARAIRGYFVFKQNSMKSTSKLNNSQFTASLLQKEIDINQVKQLTDLKQTLVLSVFDFADPDKDSIWTADITTPPVDGQYEIITVIDYQDQRLQPKELTLVTVVDPEGYVYTQMAGGIKGRVPNAKVSIYWLNPAAESYELWPAKGYQQVNPQITDDTGKYSFLVPEGTYYLKVEAKGYSVYQGNIFEVKTGNGIHQNIELQAKNWWLQFFDWKVVVLIIFGVLLVYNFYSDIKRRKQNSKA